MASPAVPLNSCQPQWAALSKQAPRRHGQGSMARCGGWEMEAQEEKFLQLFGGGHCLLGSGKIHTYNNIIYKHMQVYTHITHIFSPLPPIIKDHWAGLSCCSAESLQYLAAASAGSNPLHCSEQ